jgi:NDP-sugar pyrophosphorylase family protein
MIDLSSYLSQLSILFPEERQMLPWNIAENVQRIILRKMETLPAEYTIKQGVAIHRDARIEEHVVLKAPVIISAHCFVAAHAYLRAGVFLDDGVTVGPGCEIKSSLVFANSGLAHFNFVGDSLVGSGVNMEAGSIIANHYNERTDKTISVMIEGKVVSTGISKFGALIGDHSRIGANAVLSPGTILPPGSIVKRLELVQQASEQK